MNLLTEEQIQEDYSVKLSNKYEPLRDLLEQENSIDKQNAIFLPVLDYGQHLMHECCLNNPTSPQYSLPWCTMLYLNSQITHSSLLSL